MSHWAAFEFLRSIEPLKDVPYPVVIQLGKGKSWKIHMNPTCNNVLPLWEGNSSLYFTAMWVHFLLEDTRFNYHWSFALRIWFHHWGLLQGGSSAAGFWMSRGEAFRVYGAPSPAWRCKVMSHMSHMDATNIADHRLLNMLGAHAGRLYQEQVLRAVPQPRTSRRLGYYL